MRRLAVLVIVLVGACSGDGGSAASTTATAPAPTTTSVAVAPTSSTTAVGSPSTSTTVADTGVVLIEVAEHDMLSLAVDGVSAPIGSRIAVARGASIRIVVHLTNAREVHVHGYDLILEVPGLGAEEVLEFVADIPGIFEVEIEGSHDVLFELEVS